MMTKLLATFLCIVLLAFQENLVASFIVQPEISPGRKRRRQNDRFRLTTGAPSFRLAAAANQAGDNDPQAAPETKKIKADILEPFLPAADPDYMNTGPVGQDSFVVSREGGPTSDELSNENILKIVRIECSDLEVNTLVWKCLGYRFDGAEWNNSECFPNWRKKYPTPPDLIGMQRIYSPEIDKPSLRSNQALVRSIPADNKQSLKEHLKPLGFRGYQYAELTPNKTRRAQCANWLIYYREELFGYSVEELREKRRIKKEEEARREEEKGTEDDWKPPVKEVF